MTNTTWAIYFDKKFDRMEVVLIDAVNSIEAIEQLLKEHKDVVDIHSFQSFNKVLEDSEKAEFMERFKYRTPII